MAELINNFPAELRALKQWVNATRSEEKSKDKIPINPVTKKLASPTDADSWATFDEAMQGRTPHAPRMGFVLSSDDPYTIIDLDDPFDETKDRTYDQRVSLEQLNDRILNAFPSYIERSQSGNGYHIIVKGSIPRGVNRDTVEIYSTQRYMVCTGDVYKSREIVDCQEMLTALFNEMAPQVVFGDLTEIDEDYEMSDNSLMTVAMNAVNADKFNALCAGDMSEYPSQSEADFALLAIIAFYTNSNEQVRRIFRMTPLGQREKALKNDRYLDFALEKIRAQQPEPIDYADAANRAQEIQEQAIVEEMHAEEEEVVEEEMEMFPPGLIGELADYIYAVRLAQLKKWG